jgi:hypothetical protein
VRLTFAVAGFAENLNQHSAAINRKLDSEFEARHTSHVPRQTSYVTRHLYRTGNSLQTMLTSGWVVQVVVFDAFMVNVLVL